LAYLARLSKLKSLDLMKSAVTDRGMKYLKNLRKLEYLNLDTTIVGDAGISPIKGLPNLLNLQLAILESPMQRSHTSQRSRSSESSASSGPRFPQPARRSFGKHSPILKSGLPHPRQFRCH
jgi:hypothetical protein